VFQDSRVIANRKPGAFEKLDEYDIDILLVQREWMTKGLLQDGKWIPIFENFNAGLYLRNTPENSDGLDKCRDYYSARGIPFDLDEGFDEHAAYRANRDWAKQFRVQRRHLKMRTNKLVAGW
jgi:hypothetical protein